ncbi:disulfide bond formation protein DsbB [Thiorhodococcus drewsii AZ1]|uniref:Disulfide bond formation protein DsbB n=1 Tax=Thiorhodococcus drewsii AZ1 TaxID=765913 RepID=G2E5D4_9GAMM|nr:disulfide bond formation protein B [Thiorhodococcus drewsii]EGV28719.1 disulfide bond formation protein DsbB [Thiorhodococcus drewsii AZ1]
MIRTTPRLTWSALAVASGAVAILTIMLTEQLNLDPCYLCVFQRLLLFIMAAEALAAALAYGTRILGLATQASFLTTALAGVVAASYQSWMQMQPSGVVTCSGGNPGVIEQVVEWLGAHWPTLFLATGFCEDAGMTMAGLSLANWALIFFVISLATGAWILWQSPTLRNQGPA